MIVDFHTHIFAPDIVAHRDAYFDDRNFAALYADQSARLIDANALIKAMDEMKVDRSVAMGFPWLTEKLCRKQNEYFVESSNLTSNRILCFGSVPVKDKKALRRTVREIASFKLSGIGETAFYDGLNNKSSQYLHNLLEAAEEYALPVCIHVNEPVGHLYPGKYEPNISLMYDIIKEHPKALIILAHWGGGFPFYELMPEVKGALKNVYYDCAASPFLYDEQIFSVVISLVGAQKILFGSDYPLISFKRYIDQINKIVNSAKERKLILGGNAESILALNSLKK